VRSYQRYEIPTSEECEIILNDICRLSSDRIRHSRKVAEVAVLIANSLVKSGIMVDVELINAGALLHDIAKGQPKHDIAGGNILRELGFGKTGDIVAVHSELAGGDTSQPLEAKIVFLADKFVDGEELVTLKERYGTTNRMYTATASRHAVAKNVKKELENLIGYPLEKDIFNDI
jgi:putative nucleotidyltransferase with HDIG domain